MLAGFKSEDQGAARKVGDYNLWEKVCFLFCQWISPKIEGPLNAKYRQRIEIGGK